MSVERLVRLSPCRAAAFAVCVALGLLASPRHVAGSPQPQGPKSAPVEPRDGQEAAAGKAPKEPEATETAKKAPAGPPALRIAGFFEAGYQGFVAKDTFDATLGTTGGAVVGGGAVVTHRSGVFFQLDVTRFKGEGERVFVFNSQVFPLGIPLTLEVTPIEFSGGYKFFTKPPRPKRPAAPPTAPTPAKGSLRTSVSLSDQEGRAPAPPTRPTPVGKQPWGGLKPYLGGGFGIVGYEEASGFASAGDDIDDRFTSFHVVGGLEIPIWKWLGAAAEFNYRWVPDALGTGGASKEFGDTDLGGPAFRFKVTIGG